MNLRLSRITWVIFVLVLLTGLTIYLATQSIQRSEELGFQKGMAFPTWIAEQYGTASSDESLDILARTTCTEWVQLIPSWYQDDRYSNRMFPDYEDRTASIGSLKHVIQTSHNLGLKVMLKPHVDAFSGDWRGTFQPEVPEIWFEDYKNMMLVYAKIAQAESVEIFSIGCEFVGLTTAEYSPDWRRVIQAIRNVYAGQLVYAANWGREALQVGFWDELDFIGIDAYFELTNKTDPEIDELLAAWAPYLTQMESIYQTWQKPVLLTEIGYRSIDGANMRPWDWENPGELDLSEQALCYQAVIGAFELKAWFSGIYWWNWEPDLSLGGPSDKGYTPFGKPAEMVLKKWYCGEDLGKKGRSRR
jgi:hypothetical protein